MKQVLRVVLCLIGTWFATTSFALQLGKISVYSSVGEPLRAAIPITHLGKASIDQLQVRVANARELDKMALDGNPLVGPVQFDVEHGRGRSAILTISSLQPMVHKKLELAVVVMSSAVKVMKPYALELSASQVTSYDHLYHREAVTSATQLYGPIVSSDTLWKVAKRVRPSSKLSVQQMMVALFAQNPQAFRNQNMNSLLKGQVLAVPQRQAVASISRQAAQVEVKEQIQAWRERRAPRVVTRPAPVKVVKQQSSKVLSSNVSSSSASPSVKVVSSDGHLPVKRIDRLAKQVTVLADTVDTVHRSNQLIQNQLAAFEEQVHALSDLLKQQQVAIQAQQGMQHLLHPRQVKTVTAENIAAAPTPIVQASLDQAAWSQQKATARDETANAPVTMAQEREAGVAETLPVVAEKGFLHSTRKNILRYERPAVIAVSVVVIGLLFLVLMRRLQRERRRRHKEQELLRATMDRFNAGGGPTL